MRIVLISPYSQIEATGLRILSACLKRAGFETRMIFLPDIEEVVVATDYSTRRVCETALSEIVALSEGSGLIGISVMTASFHVARQLSQALRRASNVPIIWGGAHPTVRPEECLRYADLVCIGEGEHAIVELACRISTGRDYRDVHNLAYLDSRGQLVANPTCPPQSDLDALPFADYEFEQHYVLHEGHIVPFSQDLMYYYLSDIGSWSRDPIYGVLTTRGCPYRCSYCINNALANIYPNWGTLRRRSAENVIAEIQDVRRRLPAIGAIAIRDDTFLANPEQYIAHFSQFYRDQVSLPFRVYTSAQTTDRAKLQHLVDAGLCVRCGDCVAACPFGAIRLHPYTALPLICDLCEGDPACVARCVTGALRFGRAADASRPAGRPEAPRAVTGSGEQQAGATGGAGEVATRSDDQTGAAEGEGEGEGGARRNVRG